MSDINTPGTDIQSEMSVVPLTREEAQSLRALAVLMSSYRPHGPRCHQCRGVAEVTGSLIPFDPVPLCAGCASGTARAMHAMGQTYEIRAL